MDFCITGLDPAPFRPLYGLSDQELAARGVIRTIVDSKPGFPDRVELDDVEPGQAVLLLNYLHQPAETPFRASHAIFVREGAEHRYEGRNEVPAALRQRTISLRAFDASGMMIDADLAEGAVLQNLITRFFENPAVSYLHAHYAKRGCYAARIDRA